MTFSFIWLTIWSFLLGGIPFSLCVGYIFLHKDIRKYGDGNPGAVNVFRAGGSYAGMVAVCLDLAKGMPFAYLAGRIYDLGENQLLIIAFAAILGHAFSPVLHGRGGKAVAVTFGALIGLGHPEMLFPFTLAALAAFVLLENHSWVVLMAPIITLIFLWSIDAHFGPFLFMTAIMTLYVIKHAHTLNTWPRPKQWLFRRLHILRHS